MQQPRLRMKMPETLEIRHTVSAWYDEGNDETGGYFKLPAGTYDVVDFLYGYPDRPGQSWFVLRVDGRDVIVDTLEFAE